MLRRIPTPWLVGLVICLVLYKLGGRVLLFAVAIMGLLAFLRPLIEYLSDGSYFPSRTPAPPAVEGIHFVYKGQTLDITEDADFGRWLRHQDLSKVLPDLPDASYFEQTYPQHTRNQNGHWRIHVNAVIHSLKQAGHNDSARFRNWLLREVARPAQRASQRAGLPTPPPSDNPPLPDSGFAETRPAARP